MLHLALIQTVSLARKLTALRDPYTAGHEERVGNLAKAIGAQLGFDEHRQEGLMIAGYLHDIGKMTIPVSILFKPGIVSPEEFNLMKTHVQVGYELLKEIDFPWPIAQAVLEHHERLDGSGYPHGLKGENISIEGHILAVADTVDAMTSHRPYHPSLGIEAALTEIERGRGTLNDKTVVDACLELFREKAYQLAKH